jgi:hypothetical protein
VSVGDLVLRTRVSGLRRNLAEVQDVLMAIDESRSSLNRLMAVVDDPRVLDAVFAVDDAIARALRAFDYPVQDIVPRAKSALQDVADTPGQIRAHIEAIGTAAHAVAERAPNLQEHGLGKTLNELLSRGTGEITGTVEAVDDELAKAEADPNLSRAWADYRSTLDAKGTKLFTEYVDLLGGLALRQTGLDDGICAMADELIRGRGQIGTFNWNSLTIPAQREALEETVAQIVRLGFPEWTIWALPLAAHEFGHVVARRDERFRMIIERDPERDQLVEMLVADAFATYVMGPAYACAAILMRLDPCAAAQPDGGGLTAARADVIFATLTLMRLEDDPTLWIRELLAREWNDALEQVGAPEPELQASPNGQSDVQVLVRDVVGLIPKHRFDPARWPTIERFADALEHGTEGVAAVDVNPEDEFRDVLNAAWAARLRDAPPASVDDLAEAARKLWEKIKDEQTLSEGEQKPSGGAARDAATSARAGGPPRKRWS